MNSFGTFAMMLLLLFMVNMFIALVWVMAWAELPEPYTGDSNDH